MEMVISYCCCLAGGDAGWISALRLLRDDPAARRHLGQAGLARIEPHYSLGRMLPILADILRQAVAGDR